MLGKVIDITINSTLLAGDPKVEMGRVSSSCRFVSQDLRQQILYMIGRQGTSRILKAKIIALVQFSGVDNRYFPVVAPLSSAYYAPELQILLEKAAKKPVVSLRCMYEKSCGAVIYHMRDGSPKFLLIKNLKSQHWGFSKGHIEAGETEEQTARREIREETGLEVQFISGFRSMLLYAIHEHFTKHVVFFLAQTSDPTVRLQISEIEQASWVSYEDGIRMLHFDNDRALLKKAMSWIQRFRKNKP
jgi:8-oxo-dGTP pyrophosphatase MutT (NUDIX family)